jgi:cytochrome P450
VAHDVYPPGPAGYFLLGSLPEFGRDPLSFMSTCAHAYGPLAHYRIARTHVYLASDPNDIDSVLLSNHRNFKKGRMLQAFRAVLGNGLVTNEGDDWTRQRRLVQPAFRDECIRAHGAAMIQCTQQFLSQWRMAPRPARDVSWEMRQLTQRIAVATLFDVDMPEIGEQVVRALSMVSSSVTEWINMGLLLPGWAPTPGNRRLHRAMRNFDEVIYRIIARHRAEPHGVHDVLSILLNAAGGMTARQIRDEVITLLIAGHETTAVALTWTWFLLAKHPEIQGKLNDELQTVLGGRAPRVDDVPALVYTELIIREALRLYPPLWVLPRTALNECVVGGYRIPAGASVIASQWVMHHDQRFFHDPQRFDPDRWSRGFAQQLPRFAYFPFGGGPRQCIGRNFAMQEAILILAMIAQEYRVSLAPGQVIVPTPSVTLYPKDGIQVQFTPRAPYREVERI